jgi:hypothetical protein
MSSLILECPYCGAQKVGFNLVAEVPATIKPSGVYRKYRVLMTCSNCDEALVGIFEARATTNNTVQYTPVSCGMDPLQMDWFLVASYPRPEPSRCPDHTPEYLKKIFLQAANGLKRGDPDASGAMSRKVVDVSTQQLLGEESKKHHNIQGRIDALAAANKLTPDLREWAHQVRLGGNDASHDLDPFTPDEADELLDFAELYLTYVYSLPARLRERRERAAKEKAAAASSNSSTPARAVR